MGFVFKVHVVVYTMCFILSSFDDCQFYEGDPALPIYEVIPSTRQRLYSARDIVYILLDPDMKDSNLVCGKVPTSIHKNVAFVVDSSKLGDKTDYLADDMGVWINNGVDSTYFDVSISADGKIEAVIRASGPSAYTVKRVYRIHGTNRSLKKVTAAIECMLIIF